MNRVELRRPIKDELIEAAPRSWRPEKAWR